MSRTLRHIPMGHEGLIRGEEGPPCEPSARSLGVLVAGFLARVIASGGFYEAVPHEKGVVVINKITGTTWLCRIWLPDDYECVKLKTVTKP